ncbi:hypothetical protein B296_00014185 [Ensete ventricosum]|uniref:Uncharacterized protein n=1 Tax=Ensete ventricosum TaxID=4639 RepID=A0A427AEN1_ENSVE|nr:hypothetical protein B296_00014185 [Ensete ventricosum]
MVIESCGLDDPTRTQGKLAPNWERLYRVIDTIREGTYTLATLEGKLLVKTWHLSNLGRFYI